MATKNKILIIVGGGTKHLRPFEETAEKLSINLITASFSDLEYLSQGKSTRLIVKGIDVASFSAVYIRLVGKRFEESALLVNYCRDNKIRVVDRIYERDDLIRIPVPKSIEARLMIKAGIPMPKTYFGKLKNIVRNAPHTFGFPFVIKGTTGKQGHAVWSPRNKKELSELKTKLTKKEKAGMNFIAQEFTKASQRSRIFVLGGKAIAGITRPTRWRRRFIDKVNGEFPEGKRHALDPIPQDQAKLAVAAAESLGVDIGGVDLLTEDKTGKQVIIEVNSAPRWNSVKKDTGIDVEAEILRFLTSLG